MTHCCEAPKSMLSIYLGKKQVLRGTFGAICRIQTQMYPQNTFESKYGAFLLEEQTQCSWTSFTIPTELKSSSP